MIKKDLYVTTITNSSTEDLAELKNQVIKCLLHSVLLEKDPGLSKIFNKYLKMGPFKSDTDYYLSSILINLDLVDKKIMKDKHLGDEKYEMCLELSETIVCAYYTEKDVYFVGQALADAVNYVFKTLHIISSA